MLRKEIIKEIDELSKRYEMLFQRDEDLKTLQGMERCLEMKMKAYGIDGKNTTENEAAPIHETKINLNTLPTKLLREILENLTAQNSQKSPKKQTP
ncbi:MAG: hypothetical protein R3Y61_00720 [Rikenellaceae bacterium]